MENVAKKPLETASNHLKVRTDGLLGSRGTKAEVALIDIDQILESKMAM